MILNNFKTQNIIKMLFRTILSLLLALFTITQTSNGAGIVLKKKLLTQLKSDPKKPAKFVAPTSSYASLNDSE
jgi:hypothetical protein